MRYLTFLACSCLLALPVQALELNDYRMIDLSHTYDAETLYWPTSPSAFGKEELAYGESDGGWFYSAYSVSTPEHGGTHIDAPIHFHKDGATTDELPLASLVATGVVIDVSDKAAANRNYRLQPDDVLAFEKQYGTIEPGTTVLLRTDWSDFWPDAMGYLGDDTPGDASRLSFPGYGAEATRLLVEQRGVRLLGVDSASIDYGPTTDFIAHRIAAASGTANLENLTNLKKLPPNNFLLLALPMKIGGGSGGPVRVIALVPK